MSDRPCASCKSAPRRQKDCYCESCRKLKNAEIYIKRKSSGIPMHVPGETSTRAAMASLWRQGIPSCPGSVLGHTWIDLVAWGCVPVEAKLSSGGVEGNPNRYSWSFTPVEMQRGFDGFFLFIARTKTGDREFVIPCNTDWIQTNGKPNRSAVTVVFGTHHFNAYIEPLLLPYEQRYDLIEAERINRSLAMRLVEPLDFSLWDNKE